VTSTTTVLIVFGAVSMSALVSSAPRKRSVEMEIRLPTRAVARAAFGIRVLRVIKPK
jgi:hypothetical protein